MAPVISTRTEVHIKAPADVVWEKLSDTSTWPDWNSFVPKAEPIDAPSESSVWLLGTKRRFTANIAGMKQSLTQKTVEFWVSDDELDSEPRRWRICWSIQGYPARLFRTLRWNDIEEVGNECIYRTGEDQEGPLAWIVKMTVGKYVEKGIRVWAEDLKKAAEADTIQDLKV
jgi:hypothetical protein